MCYPRYHTTSEPINSQSLSHSQCVTAVHVNTQTAPVLHLLATLNTRKWASVSAVNISNVDPEV